MSAIRENRTIKLPDFDRTESPPSGSQFALAAINDSPGIYSGTLGPYSYHFEGEEDLLHLFVMRLDGKNITVGEARVVTAYLYGNVPKALIWLKPGKYSQHFYLGHDHLLAYLQEY
jgi:hypothetical protein